MSLELDRRRALLAVALGFLQLAPRAPELRLLHRWTGLGLVVAGVERQGLRFSLSHITKGEWWRRSWPSFVLPTIRALRTVAMAGASKARSDL